MKQHITVEQLNELSDDDKVKLDKWYSTQPYEYEVVGIDEYGVTAKVTSPGPLLSIGQMIEFLVSKGKNFSMGYDRNPDLWTFTNGKWWANSKGEVKDGQEYPELCDALWEAVKEVLEQ